MATTLVLGKEPGLPLSCFPSAGDDTEPSEIRQKPTVLVVDDESLIADTLAEILNDSGDFEATPVYDASKALQIARSRIPDIIITDVVMPDMNGIQLGKAIRSVCPDTRVVLLSGQAQTRDLVEQAQHEGFGFELWAKPIHPDIVLERLKQNPE
jgi:DNA-binding NtrC family response regulator